MKMLFHVCFYVHTFYMQIDREQKEVARREVVTTCHIAIIVFANRKTFDKKKRLNICNFHDISRIHKKILYAKSSNVVTTLG